jgi:hypothetical protein
MLHVRTGQSQLKQKRPQALSLCGYRISESAAAVRCMETDPSLNACGVEKGCSARETPRMLPNRDILTGAMDWRPGGRTRGDPFRLRASLILTCRVRLPGRLFRFGSRRTLPCLLPQKPHPSIRTRLRSWHRRSKPPSPVEPWRYCRLKSSFTCCLQPTHQQADVQKLPTAKTTFDRPAVVESMR